MNDGVEMQADAELGRLDRLPQAPQRRVANARVTRMGNKVDPSILEKAIRPLDLAGSQRSCSEQVLEVLQDAIISARILPGTPLSEIAIANVLGVSRTPVREALRQLAQEDLVRVYPQAATVISPLNLAFLNQGCFIRRSLECANIQELAADISTRDLRVIAGLIEAQKASMERNEPGEFFRLDEEMHRQLFVIAGHSLAWDHIKQVKQHFDRVRWFLHRNPSHVARAYAEHVLMFERLKSGDGIKAAQAMYEHISAISKDLLNLRGNVPEHFFEE